MGRIPEETINEIRTRVDIVDLVGRYVELKKAGRNFKGLCPFHGEKTPSFNVNPDRQMYHCFGCGEGGNVLTFVMAHDNLTFPEAARTLAHEVGIEIPETGGSDADRGISQRIFDANEIAQKLYRDALRLPEAEAAREYLKRRGLSDEQVQTLGVGYAPDRWDAVANALRDAKVGGDFGATAGLLAERQSGGYYDRFRGRVIFPILDVRGRILGFGGRALGEDQEPKYLNTPETPVFKKRDALYGFPDALEAIRRSGRSIICEGYFDRIALWRAELGEGLATCGTALTPQHAKQLRRRTRVVVLLFDGDAAGQKAVERALEVLLPEMLRVKVVTLPAAQDPDDYLAERGAEALRSLVDAADDALDALIHRVTAKGCNTPAAKADAVERVGPLVALVPNMVEREAYIEALAVAVGSPIGAVAAMVRGGRSRATEGESLATSTARINDSLRSAFEQLCRALLLVPEASSESLGARLEECLPEILGWKELALALAHAPLDGLLTAPAEIDVHKLTEALSPDAAKALASVITSDVPWPEGLDPLSEVGVVIAHFERESRRERARNLEDKARRRPDSAGDEAALLDEAARLIEERRSALNISSTRNAVVARG